MKDHKLLGKYWNAESSLAEEARLRAELSEAQGMEAAYFRLLAAARERQSRLTPDRILRNAPDSPSSPPAATIGPRARWLAAAAAILTLVLSGYGLWPFSRQIGTEAEGMVAEAYLDETYDDPEVALEEVKRALAYMSNKFHRTQARAFRQIEKAGEYSAIVK